MGITQTVLFNDPMFATVSKKVDNKHTVEKSLNTKRKSCNDPLSCETCGLCNLPHLINPKIKGVGNCGKGIFIIAEAPGRNEDIDGVPLSENGASGRIMRNVLNEFNIDIDEDCYRTNVVQCRPKDNEFPGFKYAKICSHRWKKELNEQKPILIFAVGKYAIKMLLPDIDDPTPVKMHGLIIPDINYNAYIVPLIHPSYFTRNEKQIGVLYDDVQKGLEILRDHDYQFKDVRYKKAFIVKTIEQMKQYFTKLESIKTPVAFDYETNTLFPLSVDKLSILWTSFAWGDKDGEYFSCPVEFNNYWENDEIVSFIHNKIKKFLLSSTPKIIQNYQYELSVSKRRYGIIINNFIHDTMLTEHVLNERKGSTSLEFMVRVKYGDDYKIKFDTANIKEHSFDDAGTYSCLDARYTFRIFKEQTFKLNNDESLKNASAFFHKSTVLMGEMHLNGLLLKRDEHTKLKEQYETELNKILKSDEWLQVHKEFQTTFKEELNYRSAPHLRKLFTKWGIKAIRFTEKKNEMKIDKNIIKELIDKNIFKTDKDKYRLKFFEQLLIVKQYEKLLSTYVSNFGKWADANNCIHPCLFLNTAVTYRSSSSNPNFQNIPVRSKEGKKLRSLLIPRYDCFLSFDLSAIEVCCTAMYSKDPTLIKFIKEQYDFHKEVASWIYNVNIVDTLPMWRDKTKNRAVFAWFYGDWYVQIGESFEDEWDVILKNLNIDSNALSFNRKKETVLNHFHNVENRFWKLFHVTKEWQTQIVEEYYDKGYVETFLGFRRRAPQKKNEITNMPIQATAFHLLLGIALRNSQQMRKLKLKSIPVLQIHDQCIYDAVNSEVPSIIQMTEEHLVTDRYDWENVPLSCKWEVGKNLYLMEKL